ncbi:hypothetical protein AVEN_203272-1 [Araneus ventricosus]|uniref:Uncharacterized protein n=1 Tax=Araneus ventricosus TaxID=182803 RepID=A0A4Y2I3N9_ARAVE|nr:hypothetical protein AVEN_203272-1 [Araneus ventricosus]
MNIIEDIRDDLVHDVEKRSSPPRTPMDLLASLQVHGVNFLQDTFRHQSSPCHVVLRHFCVLVGARHDIKKQQLFWEVLRECEPSSNDEDRVRAGKPSPSFPTTPEGGHLAPQHIIYRTTGTYTQRILGGIEFQIFNPPGMKLGSYH